MAMMTPVPAHFGRGQFSRALLDRSGIAGTDQRQRLRALGRRRDDEKHADSREAQNFRSVHPHSPSYAMSSRPRRAAAPLGNCPAATQIEIISGDVNAD
jgi:hypothetical protein